MSAVFLSACLLLPVSFGQDTASSNLRPLDYANGLVGTMPLDQQKLLGNAPPAGEMLYSGYTSQGAALPQSAAIFAPIEYNLALAHPGAAAGAFYYYSNRRRMYGFSSGAFAGPSIMPIVGNWTVPPQRAGSSYDRAREKSSPGYYSVYLNEYKTKVEMTATRWTGIYRFTFPATDKAQILLELNRLGGDIEIVGDHTIRGKLLFSDPPDNPPGGIDGPNNAYFVAEFSRPFKAFGPFRRILPTTESYGSILGHQDVEPGVRKLSGHYAGAYAQFATTQGEQILVKIAHGSSYAAAEARLQAEDPGWNFDQVKKQAQDAWAKKLNQIEVKGGTEKERMLFYSTLLHSYASPRLVAKKGEQFFGLDGKIHTATHDRYNEIPFWDTGRNQIVLLMLLEPKEMTDILQSQLDMAHETGYMGTGFHGDHADLVYLGAWLRGIQFDREAVYQSLRKNAMDPNGPRGYLTEYMKQGWISDFIPSGNPNPPYAGGKAGVATTLEYSWDDHALALYARKLGKQADYEMFLKRAHNYRNVFDPADGFMRGRTADGKWISPFDPREPYYNYMMKEGSGWSTLWLVPHDVQGLINLLGGRAKFDAKLDEFFSTPYTAKGICRDCTGVIGQYVQGNQPDQQAAYYYDWGGQPWKTQRLSREILRLMYGSDKSGLAFPGMDDQGSTSSWYVMSAMGFYPVDPSTPDYIIGSPIFDRVTIHLENGKDFVIVAHNNSLQNMYIQSATLNGRPWNKPWFSQSDIANGARLVFQMGPKPNKSWGAAPDAAPPSMSAPSEQ